MEKDDILKNVAYLTAEQLFDCIYLQKKVTLSQVQGTGELNEKKRKEINDLKVKLDSKDQEAWEKARYGNELVLSDYITNYPDGKYIQEAKNKIKYLEDERQRIKVEKQGILNNLNSNPNKYTPFQINDFLQKGKITTLDLHNCGVPDKVISAISSFKPTYLELGITPSSIPDGYTEVYFWGIPGSGKTCTLAAILSAAEQAGYLEIATGPGYNYMTLLKNIFIDDNAILPPPTNVEETQYLPFILKKGKDKPRSVSLIELSGEIFQCFFKKNAGKTLFEQHERTFNTLMNFLSGKNRKIHFFFIDFDKENKKDADGYTQSDYLNAASTFFKNKDIFGKTTDAVYLVITKSDLMPCTKEERIAYSKKHLENNNFLAFINTLKERCKQHSINAGRLTIEPFSLGKVYFQQICDFDKTSANKMIDILIERIAPNKKSLLDVFNK